MKTITPKLPHNIPVWGAYSEPCGTINKLGQHPPFGRTLSQRASGKPALDVRSPFGINDRPTRDMTAFTVGGGPSPPANTSYPDARCRALNRTNKVKKRNNTKWSYQMN